MARRAALIVVVLVATAALAAVAIQRRSDLASWSRYFQAATQTTAPAPSAAIASEGLETPRGEVVLDTRRQQLIGVRTVAVRRATMAPELRATGTVTYNETTQAEINTKVDGWIRDLYADYTGRPIRRGETLFTLYSPDLVATQNEYLLALSGQLHAEHSPAANLRRYSDRLVSAARERLLRFDMEPEEIDEMQKSGRAAETIPFRSPVSGVIVEKAAVRGMRVMAGQTLYRVADLSTVWVEAEIYDTDLPNVRTGTPAVVDVQAYPERSFPGRVSYIHPIVTEQTRTVRVRVALANPGGLLKPNMLATVTLQGRRSDALVIPADALIDTGTQQVVFVAEGEGRFTPRTVRAGRRTSGDVEILSGLNESEQVAASATFFVDSESQLRGTLQSYQPSEETSGHQSAHAAPNLDVTFRSEPDPPKPGEATFIVTLKDAAGTPIDDANVSIVLFMPPMPTMNMPAVKADARLLAAGGGVYRGTGQVMTPGRWDVTVNITKGGQPLTTRQFALVAR